MKEEGLVCYRSAILYIYAKSGLKCSRFNIFSFFAKHVCKVKTSSFEYCKHGIHET